MSIQIIDGFQIIPNKDGHVLGIESSRLDECMEYAVHRNITKIFIHGNVYKLNNVDFLERNNFFTQLTISQDLGNIDISAMHRNPTTKCI